MHDALHLPAAPLLDSLGDAALLLDNKGCVLAANQAALELYEASQPAGLHFVELCAQEVANFRQERLQQVIESRNAQCFVDEDETRVFQHTLTPLPREYGAGVLALCRDVTQQRLQDIELRRELQRQIFYLESLPGYVLLLRPGGEIVYVNRLFRQFFGRPGSRRCHEILASSSPYGLCPPAETMREGLPRQWEWKHPDGFVFQAHARPMSDGENGLVIMVLGMDVTAQKHAESALQQALEYQRAILDNIPDLVWLKDENNRFVAVNNAYASACGMDPHLLEGAGHEDAWGPQQGGLLQKRDHKVLELQQRRKDEEQIEDIHGEERWLEAVRVPICSADGRLLGLTGIARDITERKLAVDMLLYSHAEMEGYVQERTARLRETVQQLEREVEERKRTQQALEKARRNAEVATRAKSMFLANMSHEIRTPLNVIITMADLALRDQNAVERTRALEMVQQAGSTLLHVINDILDFSKIEARKLTLEHVDFDLRKTLEGIWSIHSLQAANKGLATRLHVDMQVPNVIKGDPGRLRQILGNLLANAVKFTREGRMEMSVALVSEEQGKDGHKLFRLRFMVSDTGIGMSPEQQEMVFQSFQQGDDATTREYGGTGLGLAIVKRLVELMQGEVGVQSAPGKGSKFSITAVFTHGDAQALRQQTLEKLSKNAPGLPGQRILLVEDNPLNMELVQTFLESQKHKVLQASDGLQALETLKTERVDLILMDIQMPMLDGVAATQTIRQTSALAVPPDVPVIALTAHALSGDRERFLEAGMDGYVSKPVDLTALQAEMARVLHEKGLDSNKLKTGQDVADSRTPAPPSDASAVQPKQSCKETVKAPPEPEPGLANREQALALLQGNEKLMRRLDGHFLTGAPKDVSALSQALDKKDFPQVKSVAHNLKSQAATIGAARAAHLARSMEGAAAACDAKLLPELFGKLQHEVQEVVQILVTMPPI